MRVLLLHADNFAYHVTGETSISKGLPAIPPELMAGAGEELLVCMMAVEKGDAGKLPGIAINTAKEIIQHCDLVKTDKVMLYPYAHLSSELESPKDAVKVLSRVKQQVLDTSSLKVLEAPFGVYKGFEIKVKGHPLSEHGRAITGEAGKEEESTAISNEKRKKSEWFVMTPEGELVPAAKFDFSVWPVLDKFFKDEIGGSRVSTDAPPHIKLMQQHELVDYEPGSDQGNFRWYPKGFLIKKLLEDQISNMLADYGAMQVETPIMYDYNHEALAKYLDKFPARQYQVISEKGKFFLRFAACFGQYLMKHDMNISYKHLPLRLYELTHYSFRREQSGELSGLRRLRTFTMPDMHTLAADVSQAKEEMLKQVALSYQWMKDLDFEYAVALRAVRSFFEAGSEYVREIAKMAGQPVLVELWDERYFYFVTKFEANVVDSQGKSAALSTVQIDVENPEGFGITYTDANSERQFPLMLHTSVSGSIDRNLYAKLEQQAIRMGNNQKAFYPFWLAPTQIRLIPVKDQNIPACEELAKRLKGRIDIDDRPDTLGKRIRMAEKEWIPVLIVVGDKELESETLPCRIRGEEQQDLSVEMLNNRFDELMLGKAYRGRNLPLKLSKRPIFRG